MKLIVEGSVLHLGRLRKDGLRHVERVTLTDWRQILAKLRSARVRSRMAGKRLYVDADDVKQLRLKLA